MAILLSNLCYDFSTFLDTFSPEIELLVSALTK